MSVRDIGLALVSRAPWLRSAAAWAYRHMPSGLHDTPTTFLKSLFADAKTVRFVQIGAFDGVAGDPIRPLVVSDTRWSGVLVEPQPSVFARLRENYSAQADRLTFLQCAISNENVVRPFYSLSPDEIERLGLPDWAGEVASFDRDHVQKHFPDAKVQANEVEIATLSELAQRLELEKIDLVVMDVEGHERTIIESIDWRGLAIQACVFEHKHMDESELATVQAVFIANGFSLKRYGRDTIAYIAQAAG